MATSYPQLEGLSCPACGCTAGRRSVFPVRVNRKRIVLQSFDFECGMSASCTKDEPKVTFGRYCKRAMDAGRAALTEGRDNG